ncbi:hypothetical protein ACH5RR_029849 [Cinchona calisaya]|uniref:Uncharacterized protein n=1 Tax=Cinchona calisaya TaxID=153742 RepID=A0ABD2YT00_9GENT
MDILFYDSHTSKIQEATDVHIEIISTEVVKPASPTPYHIRKHKLSIFDQLTPHMYTTPFVFFYPNDQRTNVTKVILERRQRLKQSLAETLVSFYPLAGRIKDNVHLEYNDDGAHYVEARINDIQLLDFLGQKLEIHLINKLFPVQPGSRELLSETRSLMIQISIFDCGGIAIGVSFAHKVVDGISILTFMKAWAATACESSERIHPSFISPSIFPPLPHLPKELSQLSYVKIDNHNYVTKRFVFDRSALAALKAKAATSTFAKPSSVTVVTGLLWKSFILTSKIRCENKKKPILLTPVNLRTRSSPPLPPNSFGNIVFTTFVPWMDDSDLDLKILANQIRNIITTIDNDFVEGMKGVDGILKVIQHYKNLLRQCSYSNAEVFLISSICKQGFCEVDFGWGKPIWSSMGSLGTNLYGNASGAVLTDTRSGDGIQAWVTIKEEDMAIFERNQDLLGFASLNPNPLEN